MKFAETASVLVAVTLLGCGKLQAPAAALETPRVAVRIADKAVDAIPPSIPYELGVDRSDLRFEGVRVFQAVGTGKATVPAELAYFTARFGARDVGASAVRPLSAGDAQPVVDAIVNEGIDRQSIHLAVQEDAQPREPTRPGWIDITFTVARPDGPRLRAIGLAIEKASGYPTYHVFPEAIPVASDCSRLFDDARERAFANANVVAQAQAAQQRVRLGRLLAIRESSIAVTQGQCGRNNSGTPQMVARNGEPVDAGLVVVSDQVNVTYAILP